MWFCGVAGYLHVIMETKGGKKSKKSSIQYESPLGYVIEDVRPHGGSEKFRTAAYSNVSEEIVIAGGFEELRMACLEIVEYVWLINQLLWWFGMVQCVRKPS